MSLNKIQQMMLIPSKKDDYRFIFYIDTNIASTFNIQYNGKMTIDYGDNTIENLSATAATVKTHTYTS